MSNPGRRIPAVKIARIPDPKNTVRTDIGTMRDECLLSTIRTTYCMHTVNMFKKKGEDLDPDLAKVGYRSDNGIPKKHF